MTVRATWNGKVIAESDETVVVEGNHYFPPDSVKSEHFSQTKMHSVCPWKGVASYYTVTANGVSSEDAAWTYKHPLPLARKIKNHVAFWNGVDVREE